MVAKPRVIDVIFASGVRAWLLGRAVFADVHGKVMQLPVVNLDGTWTLVPEGARNIRIVERKAALCGRRCLNTITAPTSKANGTLIASGCTCCRPRDWRALPIEWSQ